MLAFGGCLIAALGTFVEQLGISTIVTTVLSYEANVLILTAPVYAPGSWIGDSVFVALPLLVGVAVVAFRSASGGRLGLRRYLAGEVSSSRS